MKFKHVTLTTGMVQVLLGVVLVGDAAILSAWTATFRSVTNERKRGGKAASVSLVCCSLGGRFVLFYVP